MISLIVLYTLTVISPDLTEWEQHQLNIPKLPLNRSFQIATPETKKRLIQLYKSGNFELYRKQFQLNKKQFLYGDHFKLHLYYALTLKTLKDQHYSPSLCPLRNHISQLPPFMVREIPENCPKTKTISIELKDITLNIDGLPVKNSKHYQIKPGSNLHFCLNKRCRGIIFEDQKLTTETLLAYFTWREYPGYIEAEKITTTLLGYYPDPWLIFYQKRADGVMRYTYHQGKLAGEKLLKLDHLKQSDLLQIQEIKPARRAKKSFYQTTTFYIISGISLVLIGGGIYWYITEDSDQKGTAYWGY